jgi:NTE family protein
MSTPTLRNWLSQAPFSLCFSSGFFGFFAHAGMVSVLEEESLLPTRLMGSSAGALVSGLWASGLKTSEMKPLLIDLKKESFWDPGIGLGLLKGDLFDELLRSFLKCERFEETKVPVQMTAFNCFKLRGELFSSGDLASAIRASCTFPGLFHPIWINGMPYIDGGVTDRSGLLGAQEGERILYHHLASRSRLRTMAGLTSAPARAQTVTLMLNKLPRCGPTLLHQAQLAFECAQEQTLRLLDTALEPRPSTGFDGCWLSDHSSLSEHHHVTP